MRIPRFSRFFVLAVVMFITTIACFGQAVATGTPAFGSFAGGPDVINLGNLNVHYDIPVYSKPGRGIPFSYALKFDNSVWRRVGVSGSGYWQHEGNWTGLPRQG